MSEISLTIGGRNYPVACADGEEEHVRSLAVTIDEKVRALGPNRSHNDSKNLLFAALMLADELHEARTKPDTGNTVELVENIATRIESLAEQLETRGGAS